MEFLNSRLVAKGTYLTDGLSLNIPLRTHREPYKERSGALHAQKDWEQQVSRLGLYHGSLGPEYGFLQVTVPECLPDRLEIVAYANEFAFMYDG